MKFVRLASAVVVMGAVSACTEVSMAGAAGGGSGRVDVAAYDEAVASLGCQLVTEADYGAVEFQASMTREQVVAITERRLAREQAVRLENGGVRLTSGSCAV